MSQEARVAQENATPSVENAPVFEEGGLVSSYVSIGDDEAQHVVKTLFAVSGSMARFSTEKDDTFRVDSDQGETYVLKIANPSEDFAEIDFQTALLSYIEQHDFTIPVPRVYSSTDGNKLPIIVDSAGQRRTVRLLSFAHGAPLDSVSATAKERESVGVMLARLRYATEGFSHPADSRVLAWDVKHLLTLKPLLDGVSDSKHREMLMQGMQRFASLQPEISPLRQHVLHNDFSKSNIVVSPGEGDFVQGIIDFGDAVRTAVAIDVSTALLNQLPRQGARDLSDMFEEGRDLLRGYQSVAELTAEELKLIPHLVMARVVARALLTLWRARMFPENQTYILRNTEQGWSQLEWFLDRPIGRISATLQA